MKQIISKKRVKEFGEVFTKPETVNAMLDMLPNAAFDIKTTFLEPTCGEGVFIIEILRRKFNLCKTKQDYIIALKSVYGMDIQGDNIQKTIHNVKMLCIEYNIKINKQIDEIINNHYIQCDSLKIMKLLEKWGKNE